MFSVDQLHHNTAVGVISGLVQCPLPYEGLNTEAIPLSYPVSRLYHPSELPTSYLEEDKKYKIILVFILADKEQT